MRSGPSRYRAVVLGLEFPAVVFALPLLAAAAVFVLLGFDPGAFWLATPALPGALWKLYALVRLHTALPAHPRLVDEIFASRFADVSHLGIRSPHFLGLRPRYRASLVLHHAASDPDVLLHALAQGGQDHRYAARIIPTLFSLLEHPAARSLTGFSVFETVPVRALRTSEIIDPYWQRELLRLMPSYDLETFLLSPSSAGGPRAGEGEWLARAVVRRPVHSAGPLHFSTPEWVGRHLRSSLLVRGLSPPVYYDVVSPFASEDRSEFETFVLTFAQIAPLHLWFDAGMLTTTADPGLAAALRELLAAHPCPSPCCADPAQRHGCDAATFEMLAALGSQWEHSLEHLARTAHTLFCTHPG